MQAKLISIFQNQVAEALTIFSSIVNSTYFIKTPIILFLNKNDILARKLACPTPSLPATATSSHATPNTSNPATPTSPPSSRAQVLHDDPPSSILNTFPDYPGDPHSITDIQAFTKEKFRRKVKGKGEREVYTHYTTATDTDLLKKTMRSVEDMIVQRYLGKLVL